MDSIHAIRQARIDAMVAFIQLKPSDTVADIGSGNGYNIVRLSKYYPGVKYHVEDIDSTSCNRKNFQKAISIYNPAIALSDFTFTYGTTTSTHLPKQYFTKVLMIAVVHEFDDKALMFADIKSILKAGGDIYIEEPFVLKPTAKKDKGCNNPYLTEEQFKDIITANGLTIAEEKNTANSGAQYRKIFRCRIGRESVVVNRESAIVNKLIDK